MTKLVNKSSAINTKLLFVSLLSLVLSPKFVSCQATTSTTTSAAPTQQVVVAEIACASYSSSQDLALLKTSLVLGANIDPSLLVDFQNPTDSFPFYCFQILLAPSARQTTTNSGSSGSGGVVSGTETVLSQFDTALVSRLVNDRHITLLNTDASTSSTSSVRLAWLGSIKAEALEDLSGEEDTLVWGTRFTLFAFVVVLSLSLVGLIFLCVLVRCCCQAGTDKNRASTYFKNSLDAYDDGHDKRRRHAAPGEVGAFYLDDDDAEVMTGICDDQNPTNLAPISSVMSGDPNQPLAPVLLSYAVSSEIADHLQECYLTLGGIRGAPSDELEMELDNIDCTPAERIRIRVAISITRF